MDFFVATRFLEKYSNSRIELYNEETSINTPSGYVSPTGSQPLQVVNNFKWFSFGGIVSFVISILIGLLAVYLSWTCNTAINYHVILKVLFAIFAWFFGLFYIVMYMILRYDTCAYIQSTMTY